MDSFQFFLSDRINRMNRIFSRFPDETVKIKIESIHLSFSGISISPLSLSKLISFTAFLGAWART